MHDWVTKTTSFPSWIRLGDNLINLPNVNQFRQEGSHLEVHFINGPAMILNDVSLDEVAGLIGFRKVDGDSTSKRK